MTKAAKKAKAPKAQEQAVETIETSDQRKAKAEPIVLSKEQQKTYDELKTTSAKIRYLSAESFTNGQIAAFLDKRYQHVRNVLTTPLKRAAQ